MPRIVMYAQPGCLSCELMRIYFEARQLSYEERDISSDPEARRAMTQDYDSNETPTIVLFSGNEHEVISGFDPALLDQLLDPAPSSDSVSES